MGFDVQLRPNKLHDPATWRAPRRIFVNSMSDLFHRAIPDDYLAQIWAVMTNEAPHHIYQILTKRPHRAAMRIRTLGLPLPPHIWIGTSVENQQFADNRIPALLSIPARVRFLSCEPLLGPVDLSEHLPRVNACQTYVSSPETRDALQSLVSAVSRKMGPTIDWVIAGGESGAKRRPLDADWVRAIRDQCLQAYVPFFYKQGSALAPGHDRELDGRTWNQFPPDSGPVGWWAEDVGD
jgi:protein gp37